MSLSRRRAWRSPASIPVLRNSFLESCPDLRDPGLEPQLVAVTGADQLDLVGVEAELVEPAQALGDPVPLLVGLQDLLAGQLLPQRLVPAPELLGDLHRVHVGREQLARLQVEQLAVDPLDGQLDVPLALSVGQLRVLLAGLRVDQVRLQRARVVPEQRVGQRAVTPEEPGQVQPDQQLDQRVEQPVGRLQAPRVGEDRPVGGRVADRNLVTRIASFRRPRAGPSRSTATPTTSTAGMPSSASARSSRYSRRASRSLSSLRAYRMPSS